MKDKEDGSGLEIDYTGFVDYFILLVGGSEIWKPVLEASTKKCYDELNGVSGDYYCDGALFSFAFTLMTQLYYSSCSCRSIKNHRLQLR